MCEHIQKANYYISRGYKKCGARVGSPGMKDGLFTGNELFKTYFITACRKYDTEKLSPYMTFAYKTIVSLKILGIRRRVKAHSTTEQSSHFTTKHS